MPTSLLDLIPIEVVHHIIFHIPNWQESDLRSCALTCRALVRPAQMELFSRVGIWNAQKAQSLLDILTHSPHLGSYVIHLEMNSREVFPATVGVCHKLFGFLPALRKLNFRNIFEREPWEAVRDAFMLILPKIESLGITYMRQVPLWVVSSCRQLQSLYVYDGYFVDDAFRTIGETVEVQPLPLHRLSIAGIIKEDNRTISPLFDLLVRSASNVVSLDTPANIGSYGGVGGRWDWPLRKAPELLNPMRNTLVSLSLDYWGNLRTDSWSPHEHPFSIGRYPHLREFSIRFEPGIDEDEPEPASDDEAFSQFAAEITWLAHMLELISTPHPLSRIRVEVGCWAVLNPNHEHIFAAWERLDSVLPRETVFPCFKAFFVEKHYKKGPANVMKQLLPETDARGLLVLE